MKRMLWAFCLAVVCCAACAAAAQPEPAEPAPAAAAAEHGDPAKVAEAIRQLGAAEFAEREAATARLLEIGPPAVSALREAARSDDPEVNARAGRTLELVMLGVTRDTPEPLRELAVAALHEPDQRAQIHGLSRIADAGPQGWRILQCMRWCNDLPDKAFATVPRMILDGTLPDVVAVGPMDHALASLSFDCFDIVSRLDGYVGACFMEGKLADALERAETWYALRARPQTAVLIARLNWAMDRRPEAVRWARRALADFQFEGSGFPGDVVTNGLLLLAAAGEMTSVADFSERGVAGLGPDNTYGKLKLRGVAALAAHLAGDAERRDRHLAAMRTLTKREMDAVKTGRGPRYPRLPDPEVDDYMVMCRLSDRALRMAVEQERFRDAAGLLEWQGRPAEAEAHLAKARQKEWAQDSAEKKEPKTAYDWLHVAWNEQWLGDAEAAAAALRQARTLVGPETRSHTIENIYEYLIKYRLDEDASALRALLLDCDSPYYAPETVAGTMAGRADLAEAWCVLLDLMRPDAPPKELVDLAVKTATGKLEKEALLDLGREALALARAHADTRLLGYGPVGGGYGLRPHPDDKAPALPPVFDLLADTCEACGFPAEAAGYLADAAAVDTADRGRSFRAAWLLVRCARWEPAVDAFARVLEVKSTPDIRYFHGWALSRAGKPAEGKRAQDLAVRLARSMGVDMTITILRTGDLDAGLAEWRLQRRIALPALGPPIPIPNIAETIGDHRQAYADRCVQVFSFALPYGNDPDSRHCDLRWMLIFGSYLDIDRALARMQAGEAVDVEALCERYLHNAVGEQEGAILLARGLDEFGHHEPADRVYAAARDQLRARLAKAPKDMNDRNRLAWLSGACGRDLDDALRLARGLVDEEPDEPAYADTLASVYYSRGEYEKAVDLAARAAAMGVDLHRKFDASKIMWLLELARYKAALAAEQQGKPGAAKEE